MVKKKKLTCKICGKGSSYNISEEGHTCSSCGKTSEDIISSEDKNRVRRQLCIRCYKKEMWIQLVDEIGGFLGNREWLGEKNLVAMAKAPELKRWGSYFGASEYKLFKALKTIQKEDDALPDFEDGLVETLKK